MNFSDTWSKSTHVTGKIERPKILITGCSTGIGYYCAKKLHDSGYFVVASCRKIEDVERLKSLGMYCVQINLNNSDSIDRGIRDTLLITGNSLDILINNGAYGQPGAVEDLTRSTLEKQFSTNVFGTHELTRKLIKKLLESEAPRIIQISSVLGLVAMKYRGAYNASKFALEALTDTMRLEFSDTKLKVILIEPGPITSNFRANAKTAFLANIDIEHSRHIDSYKRALKRFDSEDLQPFTLSEEAVYKKIHHAVFSKKPKHRYYVTKPTYILGYLKRFLSTSFMDKILINIDSKEQKLYSKRNSSKKI